MKLKYWEFSIQNITYNYIFSTEIYNSPQPNIVLMFIFTFVFFHESLLMHTFPCVLIWWLTEDKGGQSYLVILIFLTHVQKNITLKMLPFAGWKYSVGFISDEMIKDHLFPPSQDTLVLMCGPPPMINVACVPNLDKMGYDAKLRFAY